MVEINYPKNRYTGECPWTDKDWLYSEYVVKDRSTKDIAEEYGCKQNTIQCWLAKFKIKKEVKRLPRKEIYPYQNKNYLYEQHIVNKKSMTEIAKRDKYTCQCCGKTHTILHVHHKKQFHEIVDEIVSENKDLNPDIVEDRLKLYQIITNDKRFLDEDNLITYCKDCHYFKIHKYKRKKED